VTNRLGGKAVEQIGSSGQPLGSVESEKGGLEQQGAHDVVRGANHALTPVVLRRSVGHDFLSSTSCERKKSRDAELSNSYPLSHWTTRMVRPN
jgi:hypothetical protein